MIGHALGAAGGIEAVASVLMISKGFVHPSINCEDVHSPPPQPYIRHAIDWLKGRQQGDGGWGEGNDSYYSDKPRCSHPSTPFQTAWAVLALMAMGERGSLAVMRGIDYLLATQAADGLWHDKHFTAPGFPRVFFLKYHGYTKYFPLWTIARYRNLIADTRAGSEAETQD